MRSPPNLMHARLVNHGWCVWKMTRALSRREDGIVRRDDRLVRHDDVGLGRAVGAVGRRRERAAVERGAAAEVIDAQVDEGEVRLLAVSAAREHAQPRQQGVVVLREQRVRGEAVAQPRREVEARLADEPHVQRGPHVGAVEPHRGRALLRRLGAHAAAIAEQRNHSDSSDGETVSDSEASQ